MKKYIVTLCLITAAAALLISGSGEWAFFFWLVGFVALLVALVLWFIDHRKA